MLKQDLNEMAVPDGSVRMGLKEEEIMWMLFREDLQQDDHLEGSEEEIQIFRGVFSSNGADSLSDFGNNVHGTEEESIRAASVQCRIIESFGDGCLCSYNIRCLLPCNLARVSEDGTGTGTGKLLVPIMANPEIEPDGEIVHKPVPSTPLPSEIGRRNEAGTGIGKLLVPIMRTSEIEPDGEIAHKPVPTTPSSSEIGRRNEPGTGTGVCSGTLDILKISNPSIKQLCNHLRAHANRLLSDCGYKLEVRRRKDDPKRCQALYRLPNNGHLISHLPKSWISVGELLQSSQSGSAFDRTNLPGWQWTDINEFASDLMKTLTYLEKMLIEPDRGLTLLDQWFLLDPFMAVALVQRKIGQLKKAVPLKVVQNTPTPGVVEGNEKMVLQRKSVTINNPLTYSRRRCKRSLLPELTSDGANRPMVGSHIVTTVLGNNNNNNNNSVVSAIIAGEEVPNASELHKELQSVTRLHASAVTTGEDQMQCTSEFHVIPDKLSKVPVTNEDHEALHAVEFGVNQDSLPPSELHINPVKIGDGVPVKKHYGGNSVIPADDVPVTLRSEFDRIPIGAKFTINQSSESTVVPQQPFLIMYPSDNINTHSQSMSAEEMQSLIDQANLFHGTLSFDDAIGGFQMKEFPVTWAMHKPLKSRLKRKRVHVSKTQENKPRKRSRKNKEMIGGLEAKCETHGRKRRVKKKVSRFDGHDLLISAIITKKYLKCRKYPIKLLKKKPTLSQHSSDQTVQLGQTDTNSKDRFMRGARTVLKLLIDTGVVYVNRKIQYLNSNGNKVKQGRLNRYGVLCQCCGENFTISGFQVHASSESGNLGLNLFLGHGTPYVMCLFQAWSMEYKGRGDRMRIGDGEIERNNDMCGLCGDGGELVCCDSCPFSFHELCLPSQKFPEDCWHCPSCICGACQHMIDKLSVFSASIDCLQCSQCDRRFHEKCMKDKNSTSCELPPGSWFCGNQCRQVYSYMRSQVGLANYIEDGYYFTILRCDHGQTKDLNLENLGQLAENNMKLALALRITEECFFPIFDPRTSLDLIPLVLYNWSIKGLGLDYKGFYTVVLEREEKIISVASIRLRGSMVAEMPLVATTVENRKKGMCRRLVNAIEKMLKLLKIKTLVLCAMPSLVETWTSRFGFVQIENKDKELFSKLSLMYVPGTVVLKKDLSTISTEPNGDESHHTSSGNEFCGAAVGENPFHLINENQ